MAHYHLRVRTLCPDCLRPVSTCLCRWVRPTRNEIPVLLLQHPLEARQAKGSARLLASGLARCRLEVGDVFDARVLADALDELGPTPVLLYPETPALPMAPAASGRPSGLVVIDATWRKSLRLLHENPALLALPRLTLTALPPSRYAIRMARRPEQRSTLEATCLALEALEGPLAGSDAVGRGRYADLLAGFDGFVGEVAARLRGTSGPAPTAHGGASGTDSHRSSA